MLVIQATAGNLKYEDLGPEQLDKKARPYLQNNQSKKA
jgi:hypothetical protein